MDLSAPLSGALKSILGGFWERRAPRGVPKTDHPDFRT